MTPSATTSQRRYAALDQFVEQLMQAERTPGMAVALTDRTRLLRVASYGYADSAARTPVTPRTMFHLGSIGRLFTSVALMQLHDAGRVDLHARVTQYLPWFHVNTAYRPITIHDLLSDTAGLVAATAATPESRYQVWALRTTETACPPGTELHFSDAGYKALGLVLAAVYGQPYGAVIQEQILAPLGMTATVPAITHALHDRLAVGYQSLYDDCPAHPSHPLAPAPWIEADGGDGCIAATPADMAAFVRLLLNRGRASAKQLLSEDSFARLTQPVVPVPTGGFYGYGVMSDEVDGYNHLWHEGQAVGYRASMRADLDNGFGAVVLTNGPGKPDAIAQFALRVMRVPLHQHEILAVPALDDPAHIENAADYAGDFRTGAGDKGFKIVADGQRATLRHGAERLTLERRGPDQFYVNHPDYARYLLVFGREAGQVVEAFHGPDWYVADRYGGPTVFEYPEHWNAYAGHYRAHNPWASNFRVVVRKGTLVLIFPTNAQGFAAERLLLPRRAAEFVCAADQLLPGTLRFDTVVEGQALRATLSGCDYVRVFTP